MKRLLSILLACGLIVPSAQSQVWIDSGAVWHYDISSFGGNHYGFFKFQYTGDTVLQGHFCQVLEQKIYQFQLGVGYLGEFNLGAYYTYVNGDTVFWYNDDTFYVLYNFSAQPGDSWIFDIDTNNYCDDISLATVQDTGTMTLNGMSFRWIDIATLSGSADMFLSGRAIERFGILGWSGSSDGFLFPYTYCDGPATEVMYRFSCFEDASFPVYNVTGFDSCEHQFLTLSLPESSNSENGITITSSTNGQLRFTFPFALSGAMVQLVSILGRVQRKAQMDFVNGEEAVLQLEGLPPGFYFLQLSNASGETWVQKFVWNSD